MKWKNGMIVEATQEELMSLYFAKFWDSFSGYEEFEWKAECEGCKVTCKKPGKYDNGKTGY